MQLHVHTSHLIIGGSLIIAASIIGYALMQNQQSAGAVVAEPTLLYVQTAGSGSLVLEGETGTLTLNNTAPDTVYFSDRPAREVGRETTADFIGDWSLGEGSFAETPPNAALDIIDINGDQHVLIVELLNPDYNANTDTLTYEVIMLDAGSADDSLYSSFDTAALFIDSTYKSYNCKCTPEEGEDSCKCKWDYTLGTSATKEFRVSCKGTGSNVDLGVSKRQPNTTCTIATSYGLGYRTKSCTNWSTSKKDEVSVNAECSY
ncbi:MAG: hypothetical protein AAGA35_02165 [Patescibacteria group bacterium]